MAKFKFPFNLFGQDDETDDAAQTSDAVAQTSSDEQKPSAAMTFDIAGRVSRAVESIIGNEAITADLDDDAAESLLDWATSTVQSVAEQTSDLADDIAEEWMAPRFKATRRLTRRVNRWIAREQSQDEEGSRSALRKVIDQMTVIYGDAFSPPPAEKCDEFCAEQQEKSPQEMIINLRQWLQTFVNREEN